MEEAIRNRRTPRAPKAAASGQAEEALDAPEGAAPRVFWLGCSKIAKKFCLSVWLEEKTLRRFAPENADVVLHR